MSAQCLPDRNCVEWKKSLLSAAGILSNKNNLAYLISFVSRTLNMALKRTMTGPCWSTLYLSVTLLADRALIHIRS